MTEGWSAYHDRELRAIAARWDARAGDWDASLRDPACHLNEDNAYHHFLETAHEAISRRQDFCQAHGVIDAGCGTGLVLAHVVPHFAWGIGVDISPRMVQAARQKKIPNSKFIVGDCFQLARLCPRAGAIFSRGVLLSHYGPEHGEGLLATALTALVPEGFLMCDFLNETARRHFGYRPQGKTCYKGETACGLAERAGFRRAQVLGEPMERALILLLQA
ncbi:MAG: class I SAM-dependent DNA methyltransferase [Limisphaerales bacterium]